MPGPNIDLDLPTGNASDMDGSDGGTPPKCRATIAVSTQAAWSSVNPPGAMPSNRLNNYHTCNPSGGGYADRYEFCR